jgi:hypothetical protein
MVFTEMKHVSRSALQSYSTGEQRAWLGREASA